MTEQPLDDVTVIDLAQAGAAPYAGALLSQYGANVISVEPPGGGSQRNIMKGASLPNVDHNKRSLVVDLKADDATDVVGRLVEDADIVIQSYRPGKMEQLGLGYEDLKPHNEQLIYCSVTGYGESGPYRDRPGFDPLAQAMSGLMMNTGEPDRKPSRTGASFMDWGTGMLTAYGVMVALHHCDRTGEGQKIEASLFDTAAAFMGGFYTLYSRTGETPTRQGHTWEGYAPVGVFETADDPVYLSIPMENLWERFCRAIDREEWLEDPRFATDDDRTDNREELYELIEEAFGEYSREELVESLLTKGVPISEVKTIDEAAEDPHLHERGTITSTEDVDGEEVLAAASPLTFHETPTTFERAPELGEHTDEVLEAAGFSEEEIRHLRERGTVS